MRITTPITCPLCDTEYEITKIFPGKRRRVQKRHSDCSFCSLSEQGAFPAEQIRYTTAKLL